MSKRQEDQAFWISMIFFYYRATRQEESLDVLLLLLAYAHEFFT